MLNILFNICAMKMYILMINIISNVFLSLFCIRWASYWLFENIISQLNENLEHVANFLKCLLWRYWSQPSVDSYAKELYLLALRFFVLGRFSFFRGFVCTLICLLLHYQSVTLLEYYWGFDAIVPLHRMKNDQ